jgi:hypothetical protein
MTDPGPWKRIPLPQVVLAAAASTGEPGMRGYQRPVADGHLTVFVAQAVWPGWNDPQWHLSISHRTNDRPPRPGRYPEWGEVTEARYRFVPDDVTMAMLLPPKAEYVNVHETCFHLWQVPGDAIPVTVQAGAFQEHHA